MSKLRALNQVKTVHSHSFATFDRMVGPIFLIQLISYLLKNLYPQKINPGILKIKRVNLYNIETPTPTSNG